MGSDVLKESREHIDAWSRDLLTCSYAPEASDAIATLVYLVGPGSSALQLGPAMSGTATALPEAKRVLICQDNLAMDAGAGAYLIDLDGKVTLLLSEMDFPRRCERVGTGDQILVEISDSDQNGRPLSTVRVYDLEGRVLVERKFDAAGEVEFSVGGKKFIVPVGAPELPG
jgi:hypothetical protein